jgi:DNA-directed RNA polymerase specialized sigma24 family protein
MASKSMADGSRRGPTRLAIEDHPAAVGSATAHLRELLRSLDELETARRAVLILAELEELAPEEVAEALEVPLATAYARLRAARHAFAESFVERADIAS